ncbi:MAG: cellulase family glycosylhydrolase [Bacteroidales bacterium]|jgi:endoglucanase|nr:cellulase family glycosylhydrolase [Bacteroidales bacterium]
MKKLFFALLLLLGACTPKAFVTIDGPNLVGTDGQPFLIKGTNLGNWLNPEGYMFGFGRATSPRMINEAVCELVGPDEATAFWKAFKDNYITEDDIAFIASTGANTIRLPFHYKLFTNEDYMGLSENQDGFERMDAVVEWCRKYGLYLILDMHDAPGGQTGDNIDDSYGYCWLFESEASQALFCSIWKKIAAHFKDEPVILGYELLNEPIAPYFRNIEELNAKLEPLYKQGVAAIREVDRNHIVLLGGAQWNGNFEPLSDWTFDDKIMYTCHRYGGDTDANAIRSFIDFRDKTGLPMYMGEIGHGTDQWQAEFCKTLEENNIGWTFWPYKKIDNSCMMAYEAPEGWQLVRRFADGQRSSFGELRRSVPDRDSARVALAGLLEAVKFVNCKPQEGYIRSIRLQEPAKVLVLREMGGHHLPFTEAVMPWLRRAALTSGLELTECHSARELGTGFTEAYDAILQLDFPPYPWPEQAQETFKAYLEEGRGGWVGLHHASLLGEFDGYPMWTWFSDFLGGIRYQNYIADLSDGEVFVEQPDHPVMKGLPGRFVIPDDEWYTYDCNPRDNPVIEVLASVDEDTYSRKTAVKMGDHPVVWTNSSLPGRNLYLQFGHSPKLADNEAFKTLLLQSVLWAAGR